MRKNFSLVTNIFERPETRVRSQQLAATGLIVILVFGMRGLLPDAACWSELSFTCIRTFFFTRATLSEFLFSVGPMLRATLSPFLFV